MTDFDKLSRLTWKLELPTGIRIGSLTLTDTPTTNHPIWEKTLEILIKELTKQLEELTKENYDA